MTLRTRTRRRLALLATGAAALLMAFVALWLDDLVRPDRPIPPAPVQLARLRTARDLCLVGFGAAISFLWSIARGRGPGGPDA